VLGIDTPANKSPPVTCPAKLFILAIESRLTCVSSTLNGFSILGKLSNDNGAISIKVLIASITGSAACPRIRYS
jgi:hypothetical protein